MGCDIHMRVERRDETGAWGPVDTAVADGRNYSLFAMLANVRNGHGFAGVDTGNPVTPISDPRGLPDDISDEVRRESDDWGVDGHSHSYFTLAELLDVDWQGNSIVHRCWIRRRKGEGRPSESHDEYAKRLQEAANHLGELPPAQYWGYESCGSSSEGQGASGWRTIEWKESWATATGASWLAFLVSLYRLGDPKEMRVVFWFDN